MPLLHRTGLASTLVSTLVSTLAVGLLLGLPLRAVPSQTEPTVPVRSLAVELAGVEEGTPAYIHTHYGTGIGVLLPSRKEVVTARHNVLTPSGSVAEEIAVGIAQMPLHNVVEVRVVAVAQDPEKDLVLLRPVQGLFPPAVQQEPSRHPPADCGSAGTPAPCPPLTDSSPGKRDGTPKREIRVKASIVREKHEGRAIPRPAARAAEHRTGAGASQPVTVHVVQDGPVARKRTIPSPAPHNAAVKRRVVEDGPLPPR